MKTRLHSSDKMSWITYVLYVFLNLFAFVLTEECDMKCNSAHLLPDQTDELDACLRGCRLSNINGFFIKNEKDVKQVCANDCERAYIDLHSQQSCKLGCESQTFCPTPNTLFQKEVDETLPMFEWHVQIIQPVVSMKSYLSHMFNNNDFFIISSASSNDGSKGRTVMLEVLSDMDPGEEIEVKATVNENGAPRSSFVNRMNTVYGNGDKWLRCVEYQAGIPRWVLFALLVCAMFVTTWMCLHLCETDSGKSTPKMHTFGNDIALVKKHGEKIPLSFMATKIDQAEPLPEKKPLLA